ncbi:UxaA family hydrolase [Sphingomonas sp. GB1N7]|uniref:UxaA family hydrolase n=1 Tax=Parasphingomonas caseinilytica TaxID=3096158 RepID=UPI002FCAAF1E
MAEALMIDPADSVATLIEDAAPGDMVVAGGSRVVAGTAIPSGHKIALQAVEAGAPVIKFGFPIGLATRPIAPGDHVHDGNLVTALRGELAYEYVPQRLAARASGGGEFMGYRRADGRVGTRNEIWVLPTVGCVARTAERIAARASGEHGGAIDGIHAFTHPFGCSQLGADLAATRRILAGLADNPNAGGVLIVGLGCESNQIDALLAEIPEAKRGMVRTLVAQRADDEVAEGVALVGELAALIAAPRERCSLDALVLGVKCGGSDGFSGLTANPLVGRMSDRVTAAGGKVIFTEIPEIFGAEQMLMNRAADAQVFEGIVAMVNGFKRYFTDHGEPVSENPSPGNIAGGITTLEEKSLGAVQKAGRGEVIDVIGYAHTVRSAGLTLLEAPGNDAVSSTALAAAGATAILFTTGRGTPLGFPVPTIKIASNSALAARKSGWIDFDAGRVLSEGFDGAETALADLLGAVASGRETAAERNGEREIAIWKRGVTL